MLQHQQDSAQGDVSVYGRKNIVKYHAQTTWKFLGSVNGKGLGDVHYPKQHKTSYDYRRSLRKKGTGYHDPDYFIDYDRTSIMSQFLLGFVGSPNADSGQKDGSGNV